MMSAESCPLVAIRHQAGGDRIAVGLVADQRSVSSARQSLPPLRLTRRALRRIDIRNPSHRTAMTPMIRKNVTRSSAIQIQSPTAAYAQASENEATSPVRLSRIARASSASTADASGSLALLPVSSADQKSRFWSFVSAIYRSRLACRSTQGCYAALSTSNLYGYPPRRTNPAKQRAKTPYTHAASTLRNRVHTNADDADPTPHKRTTLIRSCAPIQRSTPRTSAATRTSGFPLAEIWCLRPPPGPKRSTQQRHQR